MSSGVSPSHSRKLWCPAGWRLSNTLCQWSICAGSKPISRNMATHSFTFTCLFMFVDSLCLLVMAMTKKNLNCEAIDRSSHVRQDRLIRHAHARAPASPAATTSVMEGQKDFCPEKGNTRWLKFRPLRGLNFYSVASMCVSDIVRQIPPTASRQLGR
jgi:hypothetical protein